MNLNELNELVISLQKEGVPSFALDWAIHVQRGLDGVGMYGDHPPYTASVDAALRLIPKHHLWELKQGIECKATVWRLERDYDDHPVPVGYTTTYPALALCIAALKAEAADIR